MVAFSAGVVNELPVASELPPESAAYHAYTPPVGELPEAVSVAVLEAQVEPAPPVGTVGLTVIVTVVLPLPLAL